MEVDCCRLAEATLGGIPLGFRMLSDHMTDGYEASLEYLAGSR